MTDQQDDKQNGEQKLAEYRKEVAEIKNNKKAFNDLAKHTFSGLDPEQIPQALLEGRMKGFEIEDFMKQNVYAIPFGNDYSLAVSIDYMRKVAMRSGQTGKSAPKFEEDDNGDVVSCSITVWKEGGHEKGYTSTVYFDEYDTGRNLWKSKPRTMIAKVAEMHALRMAFPEELQNAYIKEEREQDMEIVNNQADNKEPKEDTSEKAQAEYDKAINKSKQTQDDQES